MAAICAAGDDRRVGRGLRSASAELVNDLGFDLVLAQPRPGSAHRAAMRFGGNARAAAHRVEFVLVLDQAHVVEEKTDVADLRGRSHAAANLRPHLVYPADHAAVPVAVRPDIAEYRRLVGEQLRHQLVEIGYRMRLVECEDLARLVRTVTEAIPDFQLRILLAAE